MCLFEAVCCRIDGIIPSYCITVIKESGSFRPWVVSPVGRFAGSIRPGSFRPCFRGGSIRPY